MPNTSITRSNGTDFASAKSTHPAGRVPFPSAISPTPHQKVYRTCTRGIPIKALQTKTRNLEKGCAFGMCFVVRSRLFMHITSVLPAGIIKHGEYNHY